MPEVRTLPTHSTGFPVRALKIEVTAGPDRGKEIVSEGDTLTIGTAAGNDLVLTDPKISRYHLDLSPVAHQIKVVDRGSTNGTQLGPATIRGAAATVASGATIQIGDTSLRIADGGVVVLQIHGAESIGGIAGRSPVMRQLMAKVDKLASGDASVLILGESGTGKELIARAIHDLGPRKDQPFVTVDCASLTETLVGSELFGHERGAFTGADRSHVGAFERAHGGTVFLDELGELPAPMQSTLLGVLERKRFRRVGGTNDIVVDVRLVSATNSDLRERVNNGSFRLDLYYRLAVVLLSVPPLRERRDDIPILIEHFLRESGSGSPFSAADLTAWEGHGWPGNVRELRNVVLRALATGEAPTVDPITGRDASARGLIEAVLDLPYKQARRALLDHFEVRYLQALLERSGGSVRAAAREARMDRSYLTELLKRHGLV